MGCRRAYFFAPAHTFDNNTLEALRLMSNIRIISDTIANDVYKENGFYFVSQQSGRVRRLPFKMITFCYHPNVMSDIDYNLLESFIQKHQFQFHSLAQIPMKDRAFYFNARLLRARLRPSEGGKYD